MDASEDRLIGQGASLVGYYGDCGTVEDVARKSTATTGRMDGGFVTRLRRRGHMSPFEFVWLHFDVTTSRAVANELVRHRIASYCQESTRYVDMSDAKFVVPNCLRPDSVAKFSVPVDELRRRYLRHCVDCVEMYDSLVQCGVPLETARDVLPLGLATRLAVGMNMRSFRNFIQQRAFIHAAADMRVLAALMFWEVWDTTGMRDMLEDLVDTVEETKCPA